MRGPALVRWLRRFAAIWALEDLVWSAWLLILAPVPGGLLLDGGRATVFLVVVGVCFAAALVTGDGTPTPARPMSTLLGVGACVILVDAGLRQLDAPPAAALALAFGAVAMAPILWVQQRRGRPWIRVPAWLRRALVWPYLMAAAQQMDGFAEALLDAPGGAPWDPSIGESVFTGVLMLGAGAAVFGAFVVAPRRIVDPRPTPGATWVWRFVAAIAAELVATKVVGPWWG